MFHLGIALILTMVGFELYINKEWPWLGHLLRRNSKLSLGFSVGLSLVLTMIFPAAGILVLLASLASTVVIQPVYRAMDFWDHHKVIWSRRWARVGESIDTVSNAVLKCKRAVMWMFHPIAAFKTRK